MGHSRPLTGLLYILPFIYVYIPDTPEFYPTIVPFLEPNTTQAFLQKMWNFSRKWLMPRSQNLDSWKLRERASARVHGVLFQKTYSHERNICQFSVAVTVNLRSTSCSVNVAKDGEKAQVFDLMTMARVSRGDEMAEVYVAGTIGYVIRISFSKSSDRLPVHPNITATYWSLHISCLRLFMRTHFRKICPPFSIYR